VGKSVEAEIGGWSLRRSFGEGGSLGGDFKLGASVNRDIDAGGLLSGGWVGRMLN
jgi:hypothetical protein